MAQKKSAGYSERAWRRAVSFTHSASSADCAVPAERNLLFAFLLCASASFARRFAGAATCRAVRALGPLNRKEQDVRTKIQQQIPQCLRDDTIFLFALKMAAEALAKPHLNIYYIYSINGFMR